jgi:predicted acetyltransferase
MSLKLRWVGADERDRVGEVRALCYGRAKAQVADFVKRIAEPDTRPGDWLLAERDGQAIGTATAVQQPMWVRGGAVLCQCVAYVGTVRTARRRIGGEPGVGTALMREVLRRGRETGIVVSALMPFRASYYDHFGYGVMERRAEWTIPLSILPQGDFPTVRLYEPQDRAQLEQCRQRIAQRGQADIERSSATWDRYLRSADEDGFLFIDRHGEGPVRGWMAIEHVASHPHGPDTVRCEFDTGYEDLVTLKGFLALLGSLRDQYSSARIQLPSDLPLHLLLDETQMTHRSARNHPTAEMRPFTRMQCRVLDHAKLIEAMKLPEESAGRCIVAIRETEGAISRLAVELESGRAHASPSDASPDVEMTDRIWAMIALGDVSASRAAELGLISVTNRTPLGVLDALSVGPAPYCREYF